MTEFIKFFQFGPRTMSFVQISQYSCGLSVWLELQSIEIKAGLENIFPNSTRIAMNGFSVGGQW
jgi:hypothetical protein